MNILLLFPGFIIAFIIVLCYEYKMKRTEQRNKVHFYAARDKNGLLHFYIGKPDRGDTEFCTSIHKGVMVLSRYTQEFLGLNEDNYKNLKWEDEPVEVFINMED